MARRLAPHAAGDVRSDSLVVSREAWARLVVWLLVDSTGGAAARAGPAAPTLGYVAQLAAFDACGLPVAMEQWVRARRAAQAAGPLGAAAVWAVETLSGHDTSRRAIVAVAEWAAPISKLSPWAETLFCWLRRIAAGAFDLRPAEGADHPRLPAPAPPLRVAATSGARAAAGETDSTGV